MAWYRACALREIPIDRGLEVLVSDRVIALFQVDGIIHVLDGICAHQGGPLAQGRLDGKCITCPWHGWQYDITSGVNLLTKKQMLECFPCEMRGGDVWIEILENNTDSQH